MTVKYLEVKTKKFQAFGIPVNGNYAQKYIIKYYNYLFIVPAGLFTTQKEAFEGKQTSLISSHLFFVLFHISVILLRKLH
jgi:hypothetical protein